jgi:competence protein ComEC
MRLPAVALVAAFVGGIVLGLSQVLPARTTLYPYPAAIAAGVLVLMVIGFALTLRGWLWPAAAVSLGCWIGLGCMGALITRQPLPAEHVLSRLAAQQLPLRTPLRWHGTLRDEPSRLPWGYGIELSLNGVDTADGFLRLAGGMRVGFTPKDGEPGLAELHAGDEVSLLAEGRLPLHYKNPGAFDRRAFLARQDIHLLATLRASVLLEKTATAKPSLHSRIAAARRRLRERVDTMFATSPQTASVLRAMLLGDRSFIDRSESVDFQKTGTFHVLVVAGLHVGALAGFLFWAGRKLRLPRPAHTLAILVVLSAYVVIVEQRAPVLRTGVMTAIVVLGSYFYRRLDLLNSAALAALLLLICKPEFVADTGFLLSFLAIGCIAGLAVPLIDHSVQVYVRALGDWNDVTRDVGLQPRQVQFRLDFRDAVGLFTKRLGDRTRRFAEQLSALAARSGLRIAEIFLLSTVLQLGMLPLMARDFHRIALLGPIANSFAVPLTGVLVPLGFLGLALSFVVPGAAGNLAHPLVLLVALQERIVSRFAAIPHSSYRIPGPPAWLISAFFVTAAAAVVALRGKRLRPWVNAIIALSFATAGTLIATYPFHASTNRNRLEVTVLDVAQGDSILVVSPVGSTLLIDGGGAFEGFRGREEHLGADPGEEAVSTYLWSRGIQELDAVALTHAHQDHVGSLTAILQNFRVSRLILGRETAAPAFTELKQVAERLHVPIEHQRRGQSFLWDGVQVDFLWPEISPEEIAPQAKNNDSLVIRLRYKDRTILLPGDAEKQVEYAMLAENEPGDLRADVLKVGHHGSKNSTMPEFLSAIAPQISIISAGEENPYGHPSPELLERLESSGSRILRTDRNGEVQILTDGHDLQFRCFEGCRETFVAALSAQAPDH